MDLKGKMFHLVEITVPGSTLHIRDDCLGVETENLEQMRYPLAELSAVLVSTPAVNFSGFVAAELAKYAVPVIFCDNKMVPAGILLPCSCCR